MATFSVIILAANGVIDGITSSEAKSITFVELTENGGNEIELDKKVIEVELPERVVELDVSKKETHVELPVAFVREVSLEEE